MKKQRQQLFNALLALFVVILPFQTRWIVYDWTIEGQVWEYGRISLYASAILLLIAAAVFLAGQSDQMRFGRKPFIYFLFIYSILVSLLSMIPAVSFYYLFLMYSAGLFGYLARYVSKKTMFYSFVASSLLQSIIGLTQLFSQQVVANKWLGMAAQLPATLGVSVVQFDGARLLRAHGSLPHPNILAGFLFVGLFSAIYLWYMLYRDAEHNKWKNILGKKNVLSLIFLLISIVVISFGMLATFSRTGILATAAFICSVLVVGLLKKQWVRVQVVAKFLVLAAVVFMIFNSWFPGAWYDRWTATGSLEQQSIDERIATLQKFNFQNIQQVLFGQGLGMNTAESYYQSPVDLVSRVQPIHNIFILALAEVGIVGLLIILQVMRYLFRKADDVSIMSTSFLLGLLVIGIFDHYLWTSWTGLCLLFFGLVNLHQTKKIS